MNLRFICGLLLLVLASIIPNSLSRKTTHKFGTTTTPRPRPKPCYAYSRRDCPVVDGKCQIDHLYCIADPNYGLFN